MRESRKERIARENAEAYADAGRRMADVVKMREKGPTPIKVCPVCRIYFLAPGMGLCFECIKIKN